MYTLLYLANCARFLLHAGSGGGVPDTVPVAPPGLVPGHRLGHATATRVGGGHVTPARYLLGCWSWIAIGWGIGCWLGWGIGLLVDALNLEI